MINIFRIHEHRPQRNASSCLVGKRINYIYILLSKEVGKQYFRVTNDFYLMQLTMMKGGRSQNNTLSNNTQQKNKKL